VVERRAWSGEKQKIVYLFESLVMKNRELNSENAESRGRSEWKPTKRREKTEGMRRSKFMAVQLGAVFCCCARFEEGLMRISIDRLRLRGVRSEI
jgi:hypothetical protein